MAPKKNKRKHSSAELISNNLKENNNESWLDKNEDRVNEIEQLFHNLFELTNDGIFIIDLEGKYIHVNQKGADMLGYSVDKLIGKKAIDFVHPNEKKDSLEKLDELKEGVIWPIYERTIINREGIQISLEINSSVVADQDGKVIYFQIVARDITERKTIEKDLRENEEKYRVLFMQARDGIVLIDQETGKIIDANPEFIRMSDRQLAELLLKHIWEIRPLDKQKLAKQKFEETKKTGTSESSELELEQPDGKLIPLEFLSRKIIIQKRDYLLSICRDISDKKLAESILDQQRQILQKQRDELDSFASTIAHDLRGRLQVISLMNELIEDNVYTEKIAEQIDSMVNFLNNSLLLAKEGVIIGAIENFDLNKMLHSMVQKLVSLNTKITFKIQEFPNIKGDKEKLYQVFENLLINVVKHSQAKIVTIGYTEDETHYHIYIKDDGMGMSEEEQKKIKLSWSTKKYTSLGLMIVKKIVDAHRGCLKFESKEGKGTTFYISLPK
ncbi:MAG: PAS domain S-box protein [Asgard group archaeon]|nr:PAS domain S-box protein [Asgard group archaeon]